MLTAFVSEHRNDWDKYVPLCLMAFRSTVHESIAVTPATMMFGTQIRLPLTH
jgi:hypothetical protein